MTKSITNLFSSMGLRGIKKLMCVCLLWLTCSQVSAQTYCTPSFTFGAATFGNDFWITSVSFGTLSYTGGTALGSSPYYALRSETGSVTQGNTYTLTVTRNGSTYQDNISVWIDWDQSGSPFTGAGEYVLNQTNAAGGSNTYSTSITVPFSATGTVRLRAMVNYYPAGSTLANTGCSPGNQSQGETKDFNITVVAGAPCSGSPAVAGISPASPLVCSGSSTTLSLTGLTPASGYTYQWMSSATSGGPYTTAAGSSTNATYATPASLPFNPTYYVCQVTCSNGGAMTQSNQGQVSLNSFLNCYCNTTFTSAAATAARGLTNVNLVGNTVTINNTTSANTANPSPYNLYASPVADLTISTAYSLKTTVGTATNNLHYVSAWIDYDQNGFFGGYTVGGTPSVNADYNVSGVNERIITVGPTTNVQTTSGFTVPAGALSGNTAMRVRYRYGATLAGIGACQQVTGSATAGGAGEVEDYRVSIISGCAAPSLQASSFATDPNPSTTSCSVNFTRGNGDGGMLVVCKAGSAPTAPTPGTAYSSPNANITGGGSTTATGSFVIYNSNTPLSGVVSVPATNLTPNTTYYFAAYEWNAAGNCYLLTSPPNGTCVIPLCIQPSTQVSAVTVPIINTTDATFNWTPGSGNKSLIILRKASAVSGSPALTTTYTDNLNYNFGSPSGSSLASGNVMFGDAGADNASSCTMTGLLPGTVYHYAVYSYFSATHCYSLTSPVTGSFTTVSCAPTIQPSNPSLSCIRSSSMDLSFLRGNGSRVIVLAKANSAVDSDPLYNTSYTANAAFGSGSQIGTGNYVVYDGSDPGTVTVPLTGLTGGTTYYFKMYEYNESPNCYNLNLPATISQATSGGLYASSSATQNTSATSAGTLAQDIIKLTIVTSGDVNQAVTLNNIVFSTTGTSNTANITNAKIFYTGNSNVFSNATQYGATFTTFGTLTATDNFALLAGNNYFWIAYDIKSTAVGATSFDATVTSITVTDYNGTSVKTLNLAPTGTRSIPAGTCPIATPVAHGSAGGCQTSCCQGEQITSFTFGNTISTLPCDASGNSGYNNLTGSTTFTVNEGSTYTMSEIDDQWFSIEYQWCVWIDWNGNNVFETTERYPSGTTNVITYGSSSQSVTVPIGVTTGNHTMRIWYQEYSHAPNACPYRTSNGPLTTSIGEILDVNVIVPNASGGPPGGGSSGPVSCATVTPVITTPVSYTQNDVASQLTATGTNLLWYTAPTGGIGSATAPTPLTNVPGTTAYYVSQTNSVGTPVCEGPRTQIAVMVNALPCGTPPVFTTCPGNQSANTAGSCNAVVSYTTAATGTPSATLAYVFSGATTGSGSGDGSGSAFNVGTTTVTVTASNGILPNATCIFDVVVTDNENPIPNVASLPDITAECSATATAPTATDNCAGTITATTVDPTSYNTQGSFVIHWSYDDGNGNIVTQNQNVIIDDVTNPAINDCPGNITSCNPVVTWVAPTASDNCGTPSLTSNFASGATFPIGTTTVTYTADDGNSNTVTCSFDVTINTSSVQATSATSDSPFNTICVGGSTNLTVNGGSLGEGANWNWYSGSCGGTLVGAGLSITVTPTVSTTYFVRAEGTCNTTACVSVAITVSSSPVTSLALMPFTGMPANLCNGTVATLSIAPVNKATFYVWDAPTGSYFNGNPLNVSPFTTTTPSVTITFGNPSGSLYTIGVQAGNACGSSVRQSQKVRGLTSAPASISGTLTACANTSLNYSTASVTGASSYLWTITGNATVSGTGTTATVTFGSTWTGGTLCVAAQTSCYTSPTKCINITNTAATLNTISGTFTACPNSVLTYSVPASAGAASYAWTSPPGSSITSGQGTNTVNVTFSPSYSVPGNICVNVTSICGVTSANKCKTVAPGLPPQPSSINGPASGLCNQTVVFNCPAQGGSTTYIWTAPAGATINSGQNTTAINATFGTFITGNLCVVAHNTCGNSAPRCITVKGPPASPGAITAIPGSWCANDPGIEFNVNVSGLTGIYTLSWLNPSPPVATYVFGGGNSTSLLMDWGTGSGAINVKASNACGSATKASTWSNSCREAEVADVNTLSVSPNPTTGILNVSYYATKGSTLINVLDLTGRMVMTQNTSSVEGVNYTQLDMSKLAKGAYMLNVQSTQGNKQIKVVVE